MPVDLMDLPQTSAAPAPNLNVPAGPAPIFEPGPGENAERGTDTHAHDPLVQLGLVDPRTGAALPTDDWQPSAPQAPQAPQPGAPAGLQPGVAAGAGQSGAAPAGQTAPQAQPSQQPPAGQRYAQEAERLYAQAEAAYNRAVAGGANPEQAAQMIATKLESELAKAQARAIQEALLPTAKAQVAQIVAQRFGNGAVKPEDLMHYDSPQAMEQAAQQLAQARRATAYQQRRAAGTDRAEGTYSPAGISPAIAGLSPEKKIELGIRRGQYS